MAAVVVSKDDQYVLNHCTRFLARDVGERRHDFGQYEAGDPRANICEPWRFPIVDSYNDPAGLEDSYAFNTVTFVHDGRQAPAADVAVTGTFTDLYEPVPLHRVSVFGQPSGLWAVSVRVPKGEVHDYRLRLDGEWRPDPINPQTVVLDNGRTWSRFFTDACQVPLVLGRRERDLLGRLVAHLLPFRLAENRRFVREVYETIDRGQREERFPLAYRLDEEVGVINYIDKVLARQERHNADDYRTCLSIIDGVLRGRYPGRDPGALPPDAFTELYEEMRTNTVPGWDRGRYGDPAFFLLMLRRHAMTGAFVHPKHGGNSAAAGWMYLEDRFRDEENATLFDWRAAIEAPLGRNTDYRG